LLKCAENCADWFGPFKDVDNQTQQRRFFGTPCIGYTACAHSQKQTVFLAAEVAVVSPGSLARPRIHEAEAEAKCVAILCLVYVVRKGVSVA